MSYLYEVIYELVYLSCSRRRKKNVSLQVCVCVCLVAKKINAFLRKFTNGLEVTYLSVDKSLICRILPGDVPMANESEFIKKVTATIRRERMFRDRYDPLDWIDDEKVVQLY